ncbi:folliculin-interacting protein N-terminus-domain-containing protein [Aspergillus caelatus]|uniref:Folliculin-interacting protein N-terminus-domain-containing protein n=1 Tax=Aspergillus caelatus TaxID=61420 RepID=A0A5N6ZQ42_9EURO|nr:folliculin-interacting protein N-terminus-domain-containing protein [Aspergillus caelatus]KAE8359343.1 folliculin-interacting protein N-terminus-domain-containing protein [Aspergillus caelatus]
MLGRLLSTAASTLNPAAYSAKNPHQLESVTEEEHTSGLLFPDASLLRRSNTHAYPLHTAFISPNASTAGAYDDRGGVDLDPTKDFRVIIAQNALGDRDACVLLDTRASSESASYGLGLEPQAFESSGARHARTVSTLTRGPRRGYLSQSSTVEPSPLSFAAEARRSPPMSSGAFMRARGRSSTLSPAGGPHDPGYSRHSTDSNDAGLLNCIFGSSAFSYRGSSTKMHIISADDEPGRTASASPASRSSFTRAYTTGSSSAFVNSNRGNDGKPPSKVTILVTRMFSVNLPEAGETSPDRQDLAASLYQESLPESGFPFPDIAKRKKIKEKKTPMYAVAITIQIPLLGRNVGRPVSRFSTQGSDSPRPGMSCSLDSDYRWRSGFLDDSLSLASPPASLDERIDLLVDHWDVINRTLSHLERLSRKEILFLLKKVDSSSGIHPKPAKPPNMQRTNQTIIHLPANILAVNSKLREEAIRSTRRISTALQTPYVVTGQSRWGVWREEGRSIVRNLGDKDHSFFFLVLITAFLGNHTEWLNALGPEWWRRRHYIQQKAQQQDSDPILANRTVIVSPDKMTARRLIFLLSAFLPPKQRFEPLPSPIRPGTSSSMRAVSQSPPNVPVLRQESLRRAIERRSRAQRLNLADRDQHQRSVSVSSSETAHRSTDDAESAAPMEFAATRRGSDARSIRTLGVPIHAKDARSKNTSIATTSTATPGSTVPVPHFASLSRLERDRSDHSMHEGTDSLASENLLKNLQRSESSVLSTNSSVPSTTGRWGSLFSGLWSSRQESSTGSSEAVSSAEIRRRSVSGYTPLPKRGPPTLSQMVKEVSTEMPEEAPKVATSGNISIPHSNTQHLEEDVQDLSLTVDHNRESSLKLSVRGDDGIVDVDLPLPGFVSLSSSGDSTMTSPKKTRTSVTSVDAVASTHSSGSGFPYAPRENDGPNINVAGWLRSFHDDFLLQAVRPYSSLEADVKRAMQAEPTPSHAFSSEADGSERWVDVATTLIADARTFTVKRLRLRRKAINNVFWRSPNSPSISQPGTPRHVPGGSISSSSKISTISPIEGYEPNEFEERFVEEPVMDLDGTLVDALERVLAQSGPSSLAHSRAPSPSRARKGDDKVTSDAANRDEAQVPSLEVPRTECRKLVLGALEEVVRSVTAEHCREDVDGEIAMADRERKRSLAGPDNTLREGVRRWLLDVEEAW